MGSFLAWGADLTESSPIKCAIDIHKRMLCQDPPSPDATIASFRVEKADELVKALQGQVITNRNFIAEITKEPPCNACHEEMINPLGFGLEDYEAAGRYRTVDANGLSVVSSGSLIGQHPEQDPHLQQQHVRAVYPAGHARSGTLQKAKRALISTAVHKEYT